MIRLITSGLIVFGVLAAVAGLSSALFTTNPVTISGNTFSTGTAGLGIARDWDEKYEDSIKGEMFDDLVPGGDPAHSDFWLWNRSTAPIELNLQTELLKITAPDDLKQDLMIAFSCDVGNDGPGDRDGSIPAMSLADWEKKGVIGKLGILGENGPPDGKGTDEARCTMTANLDEKSNAQGETATFDAQFTGEQKL
ncbi:MAG: hypothetical protein G01um101438_726 [Parcubacteria group bacterium Gr01-1014_38]|nr:MAG: hypothetical protein G01um101438_726 [Parcubacteria group bacterium Gr01-1014_38]